MGVEVKQGRNEGPIVGGEPGPKAVSEIGPVTYSEGQAPTVLGRPLDEVQNDVAAQQAAYRESAAASVTAERVDESLSSKVTDGNPVGRTTRTAVKTKTARVSKPKK